MLNHAQLLAFDAISKLVTLALEDPNDPVRRKATYALSSEVRNYPPALNQLVQKLPEKLRPNGTIDAGDMEQVDKVMDVIKQAKGEASP